MAEDVDHMPCRSGRPMVFIKPHDDIVTATTMPKMQVRPPSHEQLVVFHFSSDVLGSSGVVSLCEPRKNHQKIATPSGQSLFRRLVADCRGLSTRCVLPRRTRNTAGHEQQKDTLRSREQKFRESVTGHAFILKKKRNSLEGVELGLVFGQMETLLYISQQLPFRFKTNNFCSAPDRPNDCLACRRGVC